MRDIRETNGAGPGDLGVRRGHGGSFRCEAETCVGSYFLQVWYGEVSRCMQCPTFLQEKCPVNTPFWYNPPSFCAPGRRSP